MGRAPNLVDTLSLTGSEQLRSTGGTVYQITVAWTGGAAGQLIYLRDGTDGTGTPRIVIVTDAANGTKQLFFGTNGVKFTNGIYYDEGAIGNVQAQITYK